MGWRIIMRNENLLRSIKRLLIHEKVIQKEAGNKKVTKEKRYYWRRSIWTWKRIWFWRTAWSQFEKEPWLLKSELPGKWITKKIGGKPTGQALLNACSTIIRRFQTLTFRLFSVLRAWRICSMACWRKRLVSALGLCSNISLMYRSTFSIWTWSMLSRDSRIASLRIIFILVVVDTKNVN